MPNTEENLIVHVGGDYSLSSYYPFYLDKKGITGKRSILYPLAKLRELFAGSFTVVNLECTLFLDYFEKVDKTEPAVYLGGHPSTEESLNFGNVDAVSLANNHAMDGGGEGLKRTLASLDERNINYVGAGTNMSEALSPRIFTRDDFRIGIIAINTIHGEKNIDAPMVYQDKGVAVATITTDAEGLKRHQAIIARSVEQARDGGSDVVLVYYHWGEEHTNAVTPTQVALAKQAADAGADLVVGTHQHVVQGMKMYATRDGRSVPLAFGLGHLVFGAIPNPKEQWSIVLEVVFSGKPGGGLTLKEVLPLPIVTDPSMDTSDAFQPHLVEGHEKELLLRELGKRSDAISL